MEPMKISFLLPPSLIIIKSNMSSRNNNCSCKPTIIFVIGSLEIGGAEMQLVLLLSQLRALNYQCHLFVLESTGPLRDFVSSLGVEICDGGYSSLKPFVQRIAFMLLAQFRLWRLLFEIKPNVVQTFLPLTNFMGSLAARLAGIPLIITSFRAMGTHQDRHFGWRLFDIAAVRLSHRIVVNSNAVLKDTIKRNHANPSKMVLIYNAIEFFRFESSNYKKQKARKELGIKCDNKTVIVIANLIPYKGHADFLEAAQIVIKHIPNAIFLIVGEDRGIGEKLRKKASDLRINGSVKFLGRRHDIPWLLASSELSVLPSHEEGFSNTILESMAAGLPVVATNVGGNPEAVIDGKTGWLVPPKNPMVMAEKIIDLLSNPERAKSWGEQGRKRAKEFFTIEKMVEGYLELYKNEFTNEGTK